MAQTAWDILKKQLKNGAFNDYEREQAGSLSVVDKDEETKRRYREYVQQVMRADQQDDIVRNQILEPQYDAAKRSQQALLEGQVKPSVQIAAGAAYNPQIEQNEAIRQFQNWNKVKGHDNPEFANMSAAEKYNIYADELRQATYSQGMRDWAKNLKGDPDFNRMSEDEKKRQYMMSLEQKAKDNGTLPENQKLELIDYKYNRLSDRERGAIDMLMGAEGSAFDRQNMRAKEALDHIINGKTLREKFNWSADANETNNRNKLEAINELKHLGWDEERIKKDVAGFKELEDYRKTQERNQDLAINPNASWQEKTLKGISNSLEDIASAPARGLLSWAGRKVEGEGAYGTNTYSKYDYMRNRDEEAVNQVRENAIGSDHPNWQTAYDIGISGAESLYTMLLTNAVAGGLGVAGAGKALTTAKKTGEAITTGMKAAAAAEKAVELGTLIPFSANAYDSAYKDAVERGFSEKQAQGFGAAVGGIEALTELISLDKYWEMAEGTKVGRNLFVRALAQAGIEGSEEVASELGQRFADYVATEVGGTGKTQKELDIEEFMAQGMSREEATEAASEKFVQQIGMAALSGAGAATMSTPIMMGVGRARAKSAGKLNDAISNRYQSLEVKGDSEYEQMLKADKERYQNNPTQFIVDQYKAYDEETERIKKGLQEIADKEKEGKKLSTSDRAFIAENAQVGDEFFKKLYDINDQSNIPYEFRDVKYDITEDEARTMLGKAANEGDTEGFIKAMQMTRNSSDENVAKNAEEIISLYSGRAEMNGITKEAIGQAMLSKKKAYIAGLNNENLGEMSAENQIAYNEGKKAYIENKTRTTTNQAAIQNAVMGTHDGGTVKLAGRFDENGVVTQDGKSVKMDELDMTSDSAITKAYQYADNYKNVNVKNEFMQGITEDTNIREYARDFKKEYDLGMSGVSEETAKQGISTLTDEQRKIAYEAGQRDARIRATNEINKGWGVVHKAEGVFYDEANVGDKKLTEMFDRIAAKLGVDIHIVDNMNNPKARGSFDKNSNTIYVNASKAIAVFHEIGEFSEVYNKEGYDDLKKAVADLSAKKFGADNFARMIRDYQTAYGRVEGQDTQADEMSGEMFNDVISAMLSTDKGAQAFANYLADNYDAQQAKTLGQQAAGIVKKLANAIKKLASPEKGNLSGEYQEAVYQIADELSEHADKFISMLDKAVQNYQSVATKDVSKSEGENYSLLIDNSEYTDGEGHTINGKDFLGTYEYGELEELYSEYVKGSKKFAKNKAGDVIIPLKDASGTIDKIAIVDSTKYQLVANKIYLISDDIFERDRAIQFILKGERDGISDSIYREVIGSVFDGQGVYKYVRRDNEAIRKEAGTSERMDSFKNNGFGRNSLNREGLNSQSAGSKSSMGKGSRLSLTVDSEGKSLSKGQQEFFADESPMLLDKNGALKRYYHGTARMDRVGTVFDPARATSGPMAYFTDNKSIAENYAKDKADTSLSRDERYDSYYTQFRLNLNGKDVSIPDAWNMLPASKKAEIKQKAGHIAFDEDYDQIKYYPNKTEGNGAFTPYELNRHKGNYLETLVDSWLETGDLLDREEDFLKVLELVGIDNAEYLNPDVRNEGVYEVYIHSANPLDTTKIPKKVVNALKKKAKTVEFFENESYAADMWDKSSVSPEEWIERLEGDIEEGTTHSWTAIPDWVTEVLKEQGYDAISDLGGKGGGIGHQVVIPFESNQIKNIDNENPTENSDIRFSIDVDEDRVYYAPRLRGNLEIVKNATDEEYRQMREDILKEMPWLRGTDTPLLRHTYDEEGNTYYWSAADGIHARVEPLINEHWNTRTSQHWEWWTKEDKDDYPIDYDKRYSIDVNEEEAKAHADKAEKVFGTTRDPYLAGYLDINGKYLNFSAGQKQRVQDHREISEILDLPEDAGWSDGMIQFMAEGNIRVSGTYGIDIAVAPNDKQRDVLRSLFDKYFDGELTVDFSALNGDSIGTADYDEGTSSSRILKDIDKFFETGEVPEGNVRYSIQVDSEGNNLSKNQKKFFKDSKAVDDQGRLLVMYHGTEEEFSVFKPSEFTEEINGLSQIKGYFSTNREYSENYGDIINTFYLNVVNPLDFRELQFTDKLLTLDVYKDWLAEHGVKNVIFDSGIEESGLKGYVSEDGTRGFVPYEVIDGDDYWRGNGNVTEQIRKAGYDAVIWSEGYNDDDVAIMPFDANAIKRTDNPKPTKNEDVRYSLNVDSEGRSLTEGQQKYFNNTKVVDDNGALKVMYHGARGAGFTVFDPDHSDDGRSLFFTDDPRVAKSYVGTYEKFKPLKPMTFDELASAMEGYTRGEIYLEEDGNDVVIMEVGAIQEDDKEVYRGNLKGAQEYFIDSIKDEFHNTDANYEVYLNLQNPYIMDAKGANWDELNDDVDFIDHFGDVDITKTDAGYEVEWMGKDFEWYHDTFKSKEDLEKKFGKLYELDDQSETFINDIYIGKDGNRIPTSTRMISQMAQEMGHDGVIIKNIYDVGMYASINENVSSTIAIAFSPEQVKDIDNINPTSSEDIRYALDLDEGDSWVDFDAYLGSDMSTKATEEQAVNILEKGMEALKNKEVDVPKLRNLALKLRNEYGSGYNVNELTDRLQKAFAYMQTEDHVDYKTMMGILRDIAKPVIESSGDKVGEQEYKDFIANFKGRKIKLTAKQKEEVKYALGSYGKFRNAIMPITISDNGDTTLDQIWDELVEQSGYMLDRDAVEGEMPLNLLDTLQAMRPTVRNDFGGDIDDMAKDLAMRIVEEYVEGETAKQMGKEIKEYRAKLKKDYQERMKELKGQVNAEARAKNKRRAEQAKEREDVRRLKHDIKQQAAKLFKWIEKPTEGKSVPHNMVVPVMQFLQAIDFVDPVITMGEDGKWHTKVFDRVDYEDGHKKFIYKDLVGDSYEDVLKQFNEAIGRGEGSKEQRTWADKMQGMREIYDKVLKDSDFEDNSMDFLMQTLDAQGLAEDFDKLLSDHKGELSMNHLNSRELTLIDNITKNIFHAVNQGNKAFSSNVDIINLAQSTIQDSEGKELKNRNGILKGVYKMLRLDNVTPKTFFKLLGSRGSEVYKFLRGGLNQEILDLKKASEFMEGAMKGIDARKWTGEGATIHDIALSNGSVKMTDAQILGLYFTIRRNGGMDRIKGGIEVDDIKTRKERIKKQNAIHLTESDIQKIVSVLTPEQIELGKKMQKYMADDCSAQGNDTSMRLYGFKKFTDSTYYPWTVDKDTVPTNNTSENVPMFTGIERSGFTKQLKEGATNPLVIRDIFDVFSDHVSQMAAYHGYAASVKDTLRWMNYREKKSEKGFDTWITNKKAINKLSGDEGGVGYITKLLLDINQANKSQYIGNFTDKLVGHYKAAAVGANLRVIAQQPTAYFRALNQIDAKYLFTVNPATAIKNIKKSQDQSPISWWKSKGYYETNLGQPIKEIVTGIATPAEKAKDIMMSPAGWADDFTWGFLYTAVENEQRAKLRGQNVSAEEFRKAVNDRFDEVVDNTQVVDSTLHRSQIMRAQDFLNKLQTAFMAEPTKSYNMLLEAGVEDMREKTGKRTARAVMAFLLSTLATSAAAAVVDAMRKNNDDEKWWETWLSNLKENMADNMNPFNLLPVVKDVSAMIFNLYTGQSTYGQSGNRFDIEAITSIMNAVNTWKKLMEGESNKTGYGVALATLKPISQITGIPVYNLTKDAVALYNTFFENIQTTVSSNSTAKNERKKELVSDLKRGRSDETLDEAITDAIEHGVSIYDLKGAVQSEYKNKYFDAFTEGDEEEAKEIANTAARAYARMGLTDEEIDEIINDWQEEVVTYSALDKAIASGEGIADETKRVMEAKDPDKIIKHIMDRYTQTVAYEDTHETESEWRKNVETALQTVDGTLDFNTANEEALAKKKEQEEKAAETAKNQAMKGDFFDAVDRKDGSAGRKALETMKNEGIEAKTVKQATSTKYHEIWKEAKSQAEKDKAKSDWMSAYKLINTVYGSKSNDLNKTWSDWEKDQTK